MKWFLILLLLTGQANAKEKLTISGTVISVHDGDTLTLKQEKTAQIFKIRLLGVDCPELNQPFGIEAAQVTRKLCLDRMVVVDVKAKDLYGRYVGEVELPDGILVSNILVAAGEAWCYRKLSHRKELEDFELAARDAKVGLWADAKSIPPWEWRKRK